MAFFNSLGEIASLIRSKNAGPFVLTFDIMFDKENKFNQVRKSGIINKSLISRIYNIPEEDILLVYSKSALAIKISIPRPTTQGDLRDSDSHGGQQFAPLVNIKIPIP